jgi:hypothetical protein
VKRGPSSYMRMNRVMHSLRWAVEVERARELVSCIQEGLK